MMTMIKIKKSFLLPLIALALVLGGSQAFALQITLKAAEFIHEVCLDKNCTTSEPVVMWGYDQVATPDEAANPTIPGPVIELPPGDSTLEITLINELPVGTEPTSLIIPGLPLSNGAGQPDFFIDGEGRQRARSFVPEVAVGESRTYVWNNVAPGTYLYQSGSHPAVQVQMGLYGAMVKDNAVIDNNTSEAYPGIHYNTAGLLVFSEIDPVLHQAVANGEYGCQNCITSTIDYQPQYFLINGQPFPASRVVTLGPQSTPAPDRQLLIRMVNAGLRSIAPTFGSGTYGEVIAEDASLYPYTKKQYGGLLPPGKTKDAIATTPPRNADKFLFIYDRRLSLTNAAQSPGGFMVVGNYPSGGSTCFVQSLTGN
ncbi:MAG: hypothetical protein C0609_03045 [Deltaproteobacteria bacterium]|nr:MAG: hypothetical protein C0609_03045 [Deltaproteobacteria bacterium]